MPAMTSTETSSAITRFMAGPATATSMEPVARENRRV